MENLAGDGAFYYYPHSRLVLPVNAWVRIHFVIGQQGRPHHALAKHFSIGAGVNFQNEKLGTIQTCGWSIARQIN